MISKAKSVRGSSQAIDYILNDKGQAIELDRNGLVGKDGKEILSLEFEQPKQIRIINSRTILEYLFMWICLIFYFLRKPQQ